jgi:hypothetical protein
MWYFNVEEVLLSLVIARITTLVLGRQRTNWVAVAEPHYPREDTVNLAWSVPCGSQCGGWFESCGMEGQD